MSTQTDWDYLIVTASNYAQGAAYRAQLARRQHSPVLSQVREVMVLSDPDGRRVGSGGSTIYCLLTVVQNELARQKQGVTDMAQVREILRRLRILIVHAGGDSRRLPAYGPCGKIFIPLPGGEAAGEAITLFDRLVPAFLNLPPGRDGEGQVVIAAGDALILFDASNVSLALPGMTALTCPATPEHASKHGVFCPDARRDVRLYLQKPSPEQQKKFGAVSAQGQTLLDIGIMSFDSAMALAMFQAFGIDVNPQGKLEWAVPLKEAVFKRGIDFYREICCALGTESTAVHHFQQAKAAGASWPEADLGKVFTALAKIPFHLQTIPECRFLHFGTTKQLIQSGHELMECDGKGQGGGVLSLSNQISGAGVIQGGASWVEGCRLSAPLKLAGQNVVVGLSVSKPLSLPAGACVDVLKGQLPQENTGTSRPRPNEKAGTGSPRPNEVWFIRCYGIGDTFKDSVEKGASFCGRKLLDWLREVGLGGEDVWDAGVPPEQRSLWNARVFPAAKENEAYHNWLWMFEPETATKEQKVAFMKAERYSAAEIAVVADQEAFFEWRRPKTMNMQ